MRSSIWQWCIVLLAAKSHASLGSASVRHQSETACAANQNGTIDNPHSASVAGGSRAGHDGLGGSIQIQDAGGKFANGDPHVGPESALYGGVILPAAGQIAHHFSGHPAAAHGLNHASGH